MSPPRTCKTTLSRPPYITAANDTQDQHSTADSELPVSDTSTESDADFIPLQDHATHITGPSTRFQPKSNREEPYTSKHLTVGSIELHEQSTTISKDETTSTPATNVKQTNVNQQKQPKAHPYPAPVRKSPLLPTPPASERLSNNTLQDHQHSTAAGNQPFQDHHHHHPVTTHTQPFQDQ